MEYSILWPLCFINSLPNVLSLTSSPHCSSFDMKCSAPIAPFPSLKENQPNNTIVVDAKYCIIEIGTSAADFYHDNFMDAPRVGQSFFASFPSAQKLRAESELHFLTKKQTYFTSEGITHLLPSGWVCSFSVQPHNCKQIQIQLYDLSQYSNNDSAPAFLDTVAEEGSEGQLYREMISGVIVHELLHNLEEELDLLKTYQKLILSDKASAHHPNRSVEILEFISKKMRVLSVLLVGQAHKEAAVFLKECLEVIGAMHSFEVLVLIKDNSFWLHENVVLELCSILQEYYVIVTPGRGGREVEICVQLDAELTVTITSRLTIVKTNIDLPESLSKLRRAAKRYGWEIELLSGGQESRLYLRRSNKWAS